MSHDQRERPMPYVVTTRRASATRIAPPNHNDVLSCREVATLEDPPGSTESGVRGLLWAMVPEETTAHEHDGIYEQIDAVDESGGTVGPLPDGTVIEVTRA